MATDVCVIIPNVPQMREYLAIFIIHMLTYHTLACAVEFACVRFLSVVCSFVSANRAGHNKLHLKHYAERAVVV